MKQKIDPTVFLDAAKILEDCNEHFACHAISSADGNAASFDFNDQVGRKAWLKKRDALLSVKYFTAIFKPAHIPKGEGWFNNRNERIMALCLCAELAKDGFTP